MYFFKKRNNIIVGYIILQNVKQKHLPIPKFTMDEKIKTSNRIY